MNKSDHLSLVEGPSTVTCMIVTYLSQLDIVHACLHSHSLVCSKGLQCAIICLFHGDCRDPIARTSCINILSNMEAPHEEQKNLGLQFNHNNEPLQTTETIVWTIFWPACSYQTHPELQNALSGIEPWSITVIRATLFFTSNTIKLSKFKPYPQFWLQPQKMDNKS